MRILFFALSIICFSLSLSAQIPDSPNKLDSAGEREGQWTLLFDSTWNPTSDTILVKYYRVIKYRSGMPVGTVRDYFLSGKLQCEGVMLSENPEVWDGVVVGFYESGKKHFEQAWISGEMHGTGIEWYESGAKRQEAFYFNGKVRGSWIKWYESGAKASETPCVNGEWHGTEVWWYESGAKKKEIPFVVGKKHGTGRRWDEDGKLVSETQWKNGTKVR